jgi:hypothetical protein
MDRAGVLQQAAQGEVLHDCDTTMKILDLPLGESRPRKPADDESEAELERTGIFTSGIVSTRAGREVRSSSPGASTSGNIRLPCWPAGPMSWGRRSS